MLECVLDTVGSTGSGEVNLCFISCWLKRFMQRFTLSAAQLNQTMINKYSTLGGSNIIKSLLK